MQFRFFTLESKIVDLLLFPTLVSFSERYESQLGSNNYIDLLPQEGLTFYKEIESALKPFEKEINLFYFDSFENYQFPELLLKHYSPFGYASISDYLAKIESLTEQELLCSFLSKIYLMASDKEKVEDEVIHALTTDISLQIDLIEQVDLSDEDKWKLAGILRQPKLMTAKWLSLIKSLESLFEGFYQQKKEQIEDLGARISDELNASNGESLLPMSNGLVNRTLLPNGNILISFIQGYAIRINTSSSTPYLSWGLDIESVLEGIKNAKEADLKERVLIFKNLGDKTRYEVVKLIAEGVASAKEIAQILGVSQATISYHINNLTSSKLLLLQKEDAKYTYKVNFEQLERAYRGMLEDFRNL
jgi:DNA-binding transcriptional ArsR family regulator